MLIYLFIIVKVRTGTGGIHRIGDVTFQRQDVFYSLRHIIGHEGGHSEVRKIGVFRMELMVGVQDGQPFLTQFRVVLERKKPFINKEKLKVNDNTKKG